MSITSFKGILVNKLLTSRLAMKWSGQKLETSSANENESCTKNSLDVRGNKIGTKNWMELEAVINNWFMDFWTSIQNTWSKTPRIN